MKKYNLWESNFKDSYIYLENIEDLFYYLEKDDYEYDIRIKNKYIPQEQPDSILEEKIQEENIELNYVDNKHQIIIEKDSVLSQKEIIISQEIYEKNKEKIKEYLHKKTLHQIEVNEFIIIKNFYYSEDLLDKAIENKKIIYLENINLNEQQLEKIKNSYLNIYLKIGNKEEKISTSNILSGYTKEQLENENCINIKTKEKEENLKYISFIKDNSKIRIYNNSETPEEYYNKTFKIIEETLKQNKNITIEFEIEKRSYFQKYIQTLEKYKDKPITLKVDNLEYTIEEYIKEEQTLENLIKNIKTSSLSQLEKYLAVYNIVKKFKPYKENEQNKKESRYIKYILNNEYMVCVGYATLLIELLDRIGIQTKEYSTIIKQADENTNIETLGAHARIIVNIKDEKYKIDGYYISDPTWDNNNNKNDIYNYALRPFVSMQKSKKMFKLKEIDYILDNNSFKDFCIKINILLNKKIKQGKDLINAYEDIFNQITEIFQKLDIEEYKKLKKYIEENKRTEKFYEEFLTETGHYIVKKSNKEILPEILSQAATQAKFYNDNIPESFKETYKNKILKEYENYKYEIPNNNTFNQELVERHK